MNGPNDPWPSVLSLPGARVVCWRPHPAGTRQYVSSLRYHVEGLGQRGVISFVSQCYEINEITPLWPSPSIYDTSSLTIHEMNDILLIYLSTAKLWWSREIMELVPSVHLFVRLRSPAWTLRPLTLIFGVRVDFDLGYSEDMYQGCRSKVPVKCLKSCFDITVSCHLPCYEVKGQGQKSWSRS